VPSCVVEPLPRPVPRLERQIDSLSLSEWPGRRGPLVCLADPLGAPAGLAEALANELAPDWRIFEFSPGPELPYQAQALEVLGLLDTFGFSHTVLLGMGLAAGVALVLAAWYPNRVAGLVLVNPTRRLSRSGLEHAPPGAKTRAWLDAPPNWARLERQITCPMLRLRARSPRRVVAATWEFLASRVQSDACY
jgi:pimeloyl-ACP methyl ester carboxylesterase